MNRILTTLTAATAVVGVGAAVPSTASANPVVIAPLAAAAILGGVGLGGIVLGTAAANANAHPAYTAAYPAPVEPSYVATPSVTVGPGCYFTRARVAGAWHRVQVCD